VVWLMGLTGLAKGTCPAAAAILSCLSRFLVVSQLFLSHLPEHLLCLVTATAIYPVKNKENKKMNNANPTHYPVSTITGEV